MTRRGRRSLAILLGLSIGGTLAVWVLHEPVLASLGRLIVENHELQPVNLGAIVASDPVPAGIVTIEPVAESGGTNAEVRALARYMRRQDLRRAIVIADRSHTRRVALLLQSWLGRRDRARPGERFLRRPAVVAPSRERSRARHRWINSFRLRDWWRNRGRYRAWRVSLTACARFFSLPHTSISP